MLNNARSIFNCFRSFENTLLESSKIATVQQKRTTFVVKRKYPIKLYRKSGPSFTEKMKHRNFIYEVLQKPGDSGLKPIDVILTDYVEGIGEKGDRMSIKHSMAYKQLLTGLAVYASPENIAKYVTDKTVREDKFSSPHVEKTLKYLSHMVLRVDMNIKHPWTLEKWHIKTSLRKVLVECPEEAITLPDKKISGPDLEIQNKEFYVTLTINNSESVKVRCRIHHVNINPALSAPIDPEFYKYPAIPIFAEDTEILDSMPRYKPKKVAENESYL